MEMNEYLIQSERTLSDGFHLSTPKELRLLHSAIGVVTEVGELVSAVSNREVDVINIGEEIADCMWYLAIPQRELDYRLDVETKTWAKKGYGSVDDLLSQAVVEASEYLDVFKKCAFYGKPINEIDHVIKLRTQNLSDLMMNLLDWLGIPLDIVLRNNIDKLQVRFPEKFDKTLALNRNLKAERTELEK